VVILAIDTTTRGGSVAVTRDDEPLSLVRGDQSRTHGERVPGEIARALDDAGLSKSAIDLIAVAAGPGAFTGLRIGLATAQGLALTLDRPVAGVSALDALVWTVIDKPNQPPPRLRRSAEALRAKAEGLSPHEPQVQAPHEPESAWRQTFRFVEPTASAFVAPWMDAQRGDVFAALYRVDDGRPMSDEAWTPWTVVDRAVTARPQAILESWKTIIGGSDALFVGDAAAGDETLIAEVGKGRWQTRTPGDLAPAVASLGLRLAREGRAGKPHLLTPIYARRPDAELERERRRQS
jgi:tRNA threonylcarbamoyl adenosine modification protein YeaZ